MQHICLYFSCLHLSVMYSYTNKLVKQRKTKLLIYLFSYFYVHQYYVSIKQNA